MLKSDLAKEMVRDKAVGVRRLFSHRVVVLAALFILYVAVRVAVMLCAETLFRQGEEPYVGTIARGLIEGWAVPPWDFTVVYYNSGSVLAGAFAAPLMLLFGPKMLALTLTSVLFQGVGLTFLFLLADRFFNRRVAVCASLFFIFSPPLFTVRSLIMNGSHAEPAVFSMVLFYVFLKIIYGPPSKRQYLFLGVITGISLWYSYLSAIIMMAYMSVWLIKDRVFFLRRDFPLYLLSLGVGVAGLFFYNIGDHFRAFEWLKGNLAPAASFDLKKIFLDAQALIASGHRVFIFEDFSFVNGRLLGILYYLVFLASIGSFVLVLARHSCQALRRMGRRGVTGAEGWEPHALIMLMPVFFVLSYVLSLRRFDGFGCGMVDYRYAAILFPSIFISIAVFVDKLLGARAVWPRWLGGFILMVMLVLVPVGNGKLFYSTDFKNNYLDKPAVYYDLVGRVAAQRYHLDMVRADQFIRKVGFASGILDAYEGYGRKLSTGLSGYPRLMEHVALMKSFDMPEDIGKRFWKGVGRGLVDSFYSHFPEKSPDSKGVARFLSVVDGIDMGKAYRVYFYGGVIHELINWHDKKFNFNEVRLYQEVAFIPREYRYLVYLHYGFLSGELMTGGIYGAAILDLSDQLPPEALRQYYVGMGAGTAHFFSGDVGKTLVWIDWHGRGAREDLLMGMGLYLYVENRSALIEKNPLEGTVFEQYAVYYDRAMEAFKDSPLP